jgi:hypothetical protein
VRRVEITQTRVSRSMAVTRKEVMLSLFDPGECPLW